MDIYYLSIPSFFFPWIHTDLKCYRKRKPQLRRRPPRRQSGKLKKTSSGSRAPSRMLRSEYIYHICEIFSLSPLLTTLSFLGKQKQQRKPKPPAGKPSETPSSPLKKPHSPQKPKARAQRLHRRRRAARWTCRSWTVILAARRPRR